MWPNEKLTHITYRSISILKHPSFNKTQDLETGDTALVYSIFASSFYQSLRSIDSLSLNQAVFFFFLGGGREGDGMEAPQLLFLFSPSPLKKEYLIARWSSFLKQRLVTKSVALVGKKVTNSLIRGFYCTETRQRFDATRRCISLC